MRLLTLRQLAVEAAPVYSEGTLALIKAEWHVAVTRQQSPLRPATQEALFTMTDSTTAMISPEEAPAPVEAELIASETMLRLLVKIVPVPVEATPTPESVNE